MLADFNEAWFENQTYEVNFSIFINLSHSHQILSRRIPGLELLIMVLKREIKH